MVFRYPFIFKKKRHFCFDRQSSSRSFLSFPPSFSSAVPTVSAIVRHLRRLPVIDSCFLPFSSVLRLFAGGHKSSPPQGFTATADRTGPQFTASYTASSTTLIRLFLSNKAATFTASGRQRQESRTGLQFTASSTSPIRLLLSNKAATSLLQGDSRRESRTGLQFTASSTTPIRLLLSNKAAAFTASGIQLPSSTVLQLAQISNSAIGRQEGKKDSS